MRPGLWPLSACAWPDFVGDGFKVEGLGLWVKGLGFEVWSLGWKSKRACMQANRQRNGSPTASLSFTECRETCFYMLAIFC